MMHSFEPKGQSLAEYSLIMGIVVLIAIAILPVLQNNLSISTHNMLPKRSFSQNARAAHSSLDSEHIAPININRFGFAPDKGNSSKLQKASPELSQSILTTGANGINIVDQYADIIQQISQLAHSDPKVNRGFAAMITDLAEEGHNVADDERAVLTYTQKSDGGFDFSIQERYANTLERVMNYLNAHPNELSPDTAALLRTTSDNISQQMVDFIGNSDPQSLSKLNINQKFTDAGGDKGATYVNSQASIVCNNAGKKVQCE